MNKKIEELSKEFVVIPFGMSCTCHKCLEGMQTCGYSIKFLACRKGESRPLPDYGISTWGGFDWEKENKPFEVEQEYWAVGRTAEEALEEVFEIFG